MECPLVAAPGSAGNTRRDSSLQRQITVFDERWQAMKFEDSLQNNIVILDVSGKIMGGEETTMFHGRIHEYITQNKKNIIVDLAKVEWMNSVGLGMLISALTTVKNAGGRLVLANITKIESVLTITRLISVFEHYDSRDEAMKVFNK
jgi:anti-sigma B factor antagonist